ncbi:MAG TPA: beta-1,6-N-acetylglucosaminyltransferase [Acidimicrobiales bacterium]|nr:beta-1,6-N-acetylglucosaminyltransferase [Acidimicrobiales bacterium]
MPVRKATTSSAPSGPGGDGMGLCYVILAHTAPEQVGRLAARLGGPGASVIVHVDRRVDEEPFRRACRTVGVDQVVFSERRSASGWGRYGLVDAAVNAVEFALDNLAFSHVLLLSGQDYPITTPEARDAFFAAAGDRSYLSWSAGDSGPPPDRSRNERWYWNGDLHRLRTRYYWIGELSVPVPSRWLPFFPPARVPRGLRPYQGSQWWNLHHDAAAYCIEHLRRNPRLVRYFRRTLIPDEFVFPMILLNSPLADRVVNEDLRFMTWEVDHPKLLGPSDLDRVLAPSVKLFARKFDESRTPGVLDLIDDHLAGRPNHASRG